MVKVIKISSLGDFEVASKTLGRIARRFPSMISKAMMRWGKTLERDMRLSAIRARIGPGINNSVRGDGIQWRQKPRGRTGFLFMRRSLVLLDSMEPHFVSVTRRRTRLLMWAKRANYAWIRNRAALVEKGAKRGRKLVKFSIFVRPHPFIEAGYRTARPKLKPILKSFTTRALRTS